jgi:phage gp46-like protein
VITITTLGRVEDAAKKAMKWMTRLKVASSVDVIVDNPTGRMINTVIEIAPPGGGTFEGLLYTRNGPNWISQKLDPAHGRIPEV